MAMAVVQAVLAGIWYLVAVAWLEMRAEGSGFTHIATYAEPWRSCVFIVSMLSLGALSVRNITRCRSGGLGPGQTTIRAAILAAGTLATTPLLTTAIVVEEFRTPAVSVESGIVTWQYVPLRMGDGGYCIHQAESQGRALRVEEHRMWVPWLGLPLRREVQVVLEMGRCGV